MVSMKHFSDRPVVAGAIAFILAYIATGMFVFRHWCDGRHAYDDDGAPYQWTWVDALYFSSTTLTTVGYGDLAPQNSSRYGCPSTMIFTCFYALFGVALIGFLMGVVVNMLVAEAEELAENGALDGAMDGVMTLHIEGHGDVPATPTEGGAEPAAAFARPKTRAWPTYRSLVRSRPIAVRLAKALVMVSATLFAGTLAYHKLEGWSFGRAFYVSCITVATVGFGDMSPASQGGRAFTVGYVFIGSAIVANMLQSVAAIPITMRKRAIERRILTQFGETLELDELVALTKMGADADHCTQSEFVLGMLMKMNKLQRRDVAECVAQFRRFDVNGDGTLSELDIMQNYEPSAAASPQSADGAPPCPAAPADAEPAPDASKPGSALYSACSGCLIPDGDESPV